MNAQTQLRTLGVLLAVMLVIMVNTYFAAIIDAYSAWFAWTVFAVMLVLVVAVLRVQRLGTIAAAGLLLIPIVLAILGAAIGL